MREIVGSNVEQRNICSYEALAKKVEALREFGYRIGLVSGSWDMLHIGHARYIERLKDRVDVVIVGVDSDKKIKARKGNSRPVVPEQERLEIICHLRHVDLVFIKSQDDEKWQLIKTVRPDVLLLSERTGKADDEIEELETLCGEVMLLESQATTSTSARIRQLHVTGISEVKQELDALFAKFLGGTDE